MRLPRFLANDQFFRQLRLFQHLPPVDIDVDIDRRERELVFGQFRRQHREHRRFRQLRLFFQLQFVFFVQFVGVFFGPVDFCPFQLLPVDLGPGYQREL